VWYLIVHCPLTIIYQIYAEVYIFSYVDSAKYDPICPRTLQKHRQSPLYSRELTTITPHYPVCPKTKPPGSNVYRSVQHIWLCASRSGSQQPPFFTHYTGSLLRQESSIRSHLFATQLNAVVPKWTRFTICATKRLTFSGLLLTGCAAFSPSVLRYESILIVWPESVELTPPQAQSNRLLSGPSDREGRHF
jgi:hypothetical protein